MAKNVVLCCDGTANRFGHTVTNVLRLYSCLKHSDDQVTYYHPGLGTMGAAGALTPMAKAITTGLGLAFGYGLSQHLSELYAFLTKHLDQSDRLFLFGFSRGAYTVRALAGMLHMFGLLRPDNDVNISEAIRLLKRNRQDRFELAGRFKRTFCRPCPVHFVGLWDTVSSIGHLHDPLTIPYSATNPSISVLRHAIAIDERRAFYRRHLFLPTPGQDVKQVWFAGAHADVGGGYPEEESGLSKISLEWMVEEATQHGLICSDSRFARILGRDNTDYSPPDSAGPAHNPLKYWWWAEVIPRQYYHIDASGTQGRMWRFPFARRRAIPSGALVHESVAARMRQVSDYRPKNMHDDVTPVWTGNNANAPGR